MKTTNQAFIEAYRQSEQSLSVAPSSITTTGKTTPPTSAETRPATWSNVEITTFQMLGDNTSQTEAVGQPPSAAAPVNFQRIDAAHVDGPHFETPQARRMKRRLSEIAAERTRLESEPAKRTIDESTTNLKSGFTWPSICAELIASAASEFDSTIRTLRGESTESLLVGIVGSRIGLGCTTTGMCLALRGATLGMHPLLLEATPPTLASLLSAEASPGWATMIARGESPLRAVQVDTKSGIGLLATGESLGEQLNSTDLFELSQIVGTLRQKHRLIVADFGALDSPTNVRRTLGIVTAIGTDHLLALAANDAEIDILQNQLGDQASLLAGVLAVAS